MYGHLSGPGSCNAGRGYFNAEASRGLRAGEEERLVAAASAYGTALDVAHGAADRPAAPPGRGGAALGEAALW